MGAPSVGTEPPRTVAINAAAEAHGVTQPAASMRLRSLERALGLQLLERARTGSRLTPAGQAAVEWAAVILDGMRALQASTAVLRRDARSHLRLGASLTVAEYLVPGWLRQLRGALPDVGVSLEMGNSSRVIDLVSGGDIELGFIEGPAAPRRLRSCDLGSDALVVVVGAGHPWARRRRPLGPAELAATPLVLREHGSGTRDILAAELGAHGLEVTALMELVVVPCAQLRFERTIRAVWAGGRRPGPVAARLLSIAEGSARPRAERGPPAAP